MIWSSTACLDHRYTHSFTLEVIPSPQGSNPSGEEIVSGTAWKEFSVRVLVSERHSQA